MLRAVGDDSCASAARTALRRLEVGDVGLFFFCCCCCSGGDDGGVGDEDEGVGGKGRSGGGRSVRRRL